MWLLYVFALSAGITNTVMSGCNSTLGKKLQEPVVSAVAVYGVGLFAAIVVALVASIFKRAAIPPLVVVKQVPWWAWIGGALGTVYIIASIIVPGKIGAGSFTGMTVTAAIITSLVMDNFGLVGFEQHPAGVARIIGACLMISGLFLIGKF